MTASPQRRWPVVLAVFLGLAALVGLILWQPEQPGRTAQPAAPAVPPLTSAAPAPPPAPLDAEPEPAPIDPRAAFVGALAEPDPAQRERQITRTLRRWLEADFPAALAHVRQMPPESLNAAVVVETTRALGRRESDEALAWAKTLPNAHLQRLGLLTALEAWASEDPLAAGRHVAAMDPGPTQMSAAAQVARAMATKNPAEAAKWAESLANSSARELALLSVASAWAQRNPAEAANWAGELENTEARAPALRAVLSHWFAQDARAAQTFVAGLPADAQTRAAAYFAPLLVDANPRQAMEWAKALSQPPAREAALAAAYSRWKELAPADAENWLKTASLPASTKTKLQKRG